MKKKLLVLTTVLVLVVSAFALTGCGGSSDSGDASEDIGLMKTRGVSASAHAVRPLPSCSFASFLPVSL